MKQLLIWSICLFYSLSNFAQSGFDGDIQWGEPFKINRKEIGPDPIGVADGSFYATKRAKKKRILQSMDLETLIPDAEVELELKQNGEKVSLVNSFIFNDRVLFLTSRVDKKAGKQHYYLHQLTSRLALGKGREIATTAWFKRRMIGAKKNADKAAETGAFSFRFSVSDDKETLMIQYGDASGATHILLMDKELDEVNRSIMTLPYETFQVVSARLTNNGLYYMVGYEEGIGETDGLIKRERKIAGDYHVLIYDAVTAELTDIDLEINNKIKSVAIKTLADGSSIAYGMYTKDKATGISGAFFQKINAKNDVEYTTLEEFEEDFITQFWSDRQKKKAEKKKNRKNQNKKVEPSLFSYIMHDLAIKENGDVVLIAEQYYMRVTSHTYRDANGNTHTTYTYHYYYNDIIAVNCKPDGEVTWKQKVKKRQYSINDSGYFSSFYTVVQGDEIYMIYNDKESNLEDSEEATTIREKRKQKRNTVAAFITLEEEGDMDRKTLFDFSGEESKTLVPKRCERMSENEFLLYAEGGGKRMKVLGWLTL